MLHLEHFAPFPQIWFQKTMFGPILLFLEISRKVDIGVTDHRITFCFLEILLPFFYPAGIGLKNPRVGI